MAKPTKKQTTLLEYISDFTTTNNYSPSYREIMHAMGLRSVSAVAEHIDNCVAAGFLKKTPGAPRSLEVIQPVDYSQLITDLHRILTEQQLAPAATKSLQETIKTLTELTE